MGGRQVSRLFGMRSGEGEQAAVRVADADVDVGAHQPGDIVGDPREAEVPEVGGQLTVPVASAELVRAEAPAEPGAEGRRVHLGGDRQRLTAEGDARVVVPAEVAEHPALRGEQLGELLGIRVVSQELDPIVDQREGLFGAPLVHPGLGLQPPRSGAEHLALRERLVEHLGRPREGAAGGALDVELGQGRQYRRSIDRLGGLFGVSQRALEERPSLGRIAGGGSPAGLGGGVRSARRLSRRPRQLGGQRLHTVALVPALPGQPTNGALPHRTIGLEPRDQPPVGQPCPRLEAGSGRGHRWQPGAQLGQVSGRSSGRGDVGQRPDRDVDLAE